MTADLVARLDAAANEIVADWHRSMGLPFPNTGSVRQQADLLREAASALRSSGEAVAELRGLRYVRDYIATSGQDYGIGSYRPDGSGFARNFSNRDDLLCCIDRQIEKLSATPASAPDWSTAQHWIDRYAGGIDDELQLDRVAEALGLPDPTLPTSTKGG